MNDGKVQYIIELLQQGDTKGAVKSLKEVNDQADKTAGALKKLGDDAKAGLASLGAALAIRAAIDSFVAYERGVARLNGTLKASGQYSQAYVADLEAQRKAFSDTTDATGTALLVVQTLLVSFGASRDQIQPMTKAILDLSAGMGMDLNTAAMEVSKAMEGIDGPLKRIGITFDANAGRSEKFSSAIQQLEARFGGLAEALHNTPSGELNTMEKAVGGLKKTFGELALDALLPAIQNTTKLATETKAFIANGSMAGAYTKELVQIVSVLGALAAGTKGFGMAWQFVAGDAIKQAGGLKAALASIPKTVQVAIVAAAVYQVYQAAKEGFAAAKAQSVEKQSASDLGAQNDKRRPDVEAMITQALQSGQIGVVVAEVMRKQIRDAFTPGAVMRGGGMLPPTFSMERNENAEGATLNSIVKKLTGVGSNPASQNAAATPPNNAALLQDQKTGMAELIKLQDTMSAKTLAGFEKERADVDKLYQDQATQIDNITRKYSLGEDVKTKALQQNADERSEKLADIETREQKQRQDDAAKIEELKAAYRAEALKGIERAMAEEDARYQRELAHINDLKNISPSDKATLAGMAGQSHTAAQANIVQPGADISARLDAESKGPKAVANVKINDDYDKQKADLTAFYDWKKQQVAGDDALEVQLEEQKNAQLAQLDKQRQNALSQTHQDLVQIGNYAETQFASGLTHAFMSIINGSKSAGQAFEEFAGQFLEQVAQMIMQLMILQAIKSMFAFGGGGMMSAGGGGATGDANGGMHFAAHGIMLAAAGIQGVSKTTGPTYMPKFNVLAGEAGSEMLTVLAHPNTMHVDGNPIITGSVGPEKLAIMSQDSLSNMVGGSRPRMMADGGMTALSMLGSSSSSSGSGGGKSHVHVSLDPGLKAEIVEHSVAASRLTVATDLNTDTPIRRGVKNILS